MSTCIVSDSMPMMLTGFLSLLAGVTAALLAVLGCLSWRNPLRYS